LEEGEVRDKTLNKTPLASKKKHIRLKEFFYPPHPSKKKSHFLQKNTPVTEVVKNRL
jgi:hypothetical protein